MLFYRFSIKFAQAAVGTLEGLVSEISTPCRQICAVDGRTGLCVGCGRTLEEIAAWSSLAEAQRQAIMRELAERLAKNPSNFSKRDT